MLISQERVEGISEGSKLIFIFLQVENSSDTVNDAANTVMQKFWDSALNVEPPDDYDTQRYFSICFTDNKDLYQNAP